MKRFAMIAYTDYLSDARCKYEAESLTEKGSQVDFYALKNKEDEKEIEVINGVNLHRIEITRYFGESSINYVLSYLNFFIRVFFKLTANHIKESYDAVHSNNLPDFMVFTALIPKLTGAKIILDIHDIMPNSYKSKFDVGDDHWLIRLIRLQVILSARFADVVFTATEIFKDELIEFGIPKEKINVFLNCASQEVFHYIPKTRTTKEFQLIYHGAVAERLGVDTAVEAVKQLIPKIPEIKLIVYGGGDYVDEFSQIIIDLGIEDYVDFHPGYIPFMELPPIIANADLGIVPTKQVKGSGLMLPVKLLEYAAMCKPIICSKIESVQRYFDEEMILYFEPENANDLAEKILFLYENPKKKDELVQEVKRFNLEYNGEKEKKKYREIAYKLVGYEPNN